MNVLFRKTALLTLLCAGAICQVSCGDDDNNSEPITPETPTEEEAMSPSEQKQYLEEVAIEFMGEMDAYNFDELSDLGKYISDTYADYDWDNVSEWAEDVFNDLKENLHSTTKEKDGDYTNYYDNYKVVIMASNFQSKFKAENGYWSRSNASNLQFVFNDRNGQECVLKLETSGEIKKVYVCNIDDWYDYSYSYGTYIDYYDRTQLTIGVPEKIVVTLTQGSKTLIKNSLEINLSSITEEKFDLSKSQLTVKTTTELNNGYTIVVDQVAYTSSKASVSFSMKKDSKTLVSATATTDINAIPALTVDEVPSDIDNENGSFDNTNITNCYVKLDILGKVQIQGKLSDVRKFVNYINMADDNYQNESTYKSYINQANSLMDINIFYNGSSIKQATCKLEAFEDSYYGNSEWYAEPVIIFYDGTSYSTFEAFFNDADFKNTINTFEDLIDDFADLID